MKRLASLLTLAVAGAALLAGPAPRAAADGPKPAPAAKNIDIAICLDISGSMNGLIDSARARLWDIVNELARVKPTPNLRVALYSYGTPRYPRENGWIQKDLDLTTDLDALYEKLFALKIDGGTELVTRVCLYATEQLKWSADKDALKIIFVCGNEPATQDRVVSLKEAADKAKARGIIINPIFCGRPQHRDAASWVEFARLSGGRFTSIDQRRGTVAITAPQDQKLIELGARLNSTYVAYGKDGKARALNQLRQDANAFKGGKGAAAARSSSKATPLYRADSWDLVDRVKNDAKFDVTKLADADLPEAMRKMTPEQRVTHVKEMTAKRLALQKQINELTAERNAYVARELKRQQGKAGQALDAAIRETLRIQAGQRGIQIPDAENRKGGKSE
jgi:hypothetical protein